MTSAKQEPPARLRCQGFVIQAVVVWDDGEDLTPGPHLHPVQVPANGLQAFVDRWPEEFTAFRSQVESADG